MSKLNWIASYNGQWVPADSLSISVYDSGFVQGVTVAEQLRTFNGQLFRLDEHLERLERSLEIVGIDAGLDRAAWIALAEEVVDRNRANSETADDMSVAIWVTPGPSPKYAEFTESGPIVCGHAQPVDFASFHGLYDVGQRLVITQTRQVSPSNWPVELKCRSRMHYYLADKEAHVADPGSRALLLDLDGFVCESSTANVIVFFESEGLVAPRREKALPGISLGAVDDLARQLDMPFTYRDMTAKEIARADEMVLTSTSPCIWPVVQLDGKPVGSGKPGPVFTQLIDSWSKLVGVDIVAQAERFSNRLR